MSAAPLGCVALFLRMLEKKARDVAANLCTVCIVKSKYNSDLRLRLKKKKTHNVLLQEKFKPISQRSNPGHPQGDT